MNTCEIHNIRFYEYCPECRSIDRRRKVYFISRTELDEAGNFIPCIAVEGKKGFYRTDWSWGKDYQTACELAAQKNAAMGISEDEALMIQLGTM